MGQFDIFFSTYHKLGLSLIVLAAIIVLRSDEQFLSRGRRAIHRPGVALILCNGLLGAATGILAAVRGGLLSAATRSVVVVVVVAIRGWFVVVAIGSLVVAIRGGLLGVAVATPILVIAIHDGVVRLTLIVVLHADVADLALLFFFIDPRRCGVLAD